MRRRVKAATVEVHWLTGRIITHPLRRTASAIERLAMQGGLGDETALMLAAAEWFSEQAELAQLRGRLGASSMVSRPDATKAAIPEASRRLARAYDAIGADAWNVLVDCLVWERDPPPERHALIRASLHGLSVWLRRGPNAKNPPDQQGRGG